MNVDTLYYSKAGAYAEGVRGGAAHPKTANLRKIEKKEAKKLTKSRKFTKITLIPFTSGSKVMLFEGDNPPHPKFSRNPDLPKINPAYAPVQKCHEK